MTSSSSRHPWFLESFRKGSLKLIVAALAVAVLILVYTRISPHVTINKAQIVSFSITCKKYASSTVDVEDVKRFSAAMDGWWAVDGPYKALHPLNILRIPFIVDGLVNKSSQENISTVLKGKKILDVGCGGGILSEALAKLGAEVTGVDASEELISVAKYHSSQNKGLKENVPVYFSTTIEEHAISNSEKYDAVVASEIIEHVNEQELFVQSCVHALKPDGKLFITTPSKTRFAQFSIIFLCEDIFRVIPKDTHQYEKFISQKELQNILQRSNCAVELIRGFNYRPLANKWYWTNHKLFMYATQAVKLK